MTAPPGPPVRVEARAVAAGLVPGGSPPMARVTLLLRPVMDADGSVPSPTRG